MSKFNFLKISDFKKETANAVSITFDIPTDLKKEFKFIAGQYVTLKTIVNHKEVRRAYSICSSPRSNKITIAIKQIHGGDFSVYATTALNKNSNIEVSAPEGKFILKTSKNNQKNYLAFAAGSGITPIMAMIKDVLVTEPNSTFTLVFGNKTVVDTLFYDEINLLKEKYSSQFFLQYVFSREQPKNSLFGRIDQSIVNYALKKQAKSFDSVYLCGPEQMILTVKETLLESHFNSEDIHFELFTSKYKNNDKNNANMELEGETEITILLDDEKTTFTMKKDENILNAALEKDLDAPYSCQSGVCSSCIAKVTEGKAEMENNSILSDEEVAEGFILTCEAHPTTSKITIDYDDI